MVWCLMKCVCTCKLVLFLNIILVLVAALLLRDDGCAYFHSSQ